VSRLAPRRLGHALDRLAADLAPATTLARVQARWPDAVGPAIAAEAEPVAEREGVVTVACGSAVWAQELDLLGPDLVRRLNASLGVAEGEGPVRRLRAVATRPRGD
jgi:predicted nucleic acid-binding Zn ribbon protein